MSQRRELRVTNGTSPSNSPRPAYEHRQQRLYNLPAPTPGREPRMPRRISCPPVSRHQPATRRERLGFGAASSFGSEYNLNLLSIGLHRPRSYSPRSDRPDGDPRGASYESEGSGYDGGCSESASESRYHCGSLRDIEHHHLYRGDENLPPSRRPYGPSRGAFPPSAHLPIISRSQVGHGYPPDTSPGHWIDAAMRNSRNFEEWVFGGRIDNNENSDVRGTRDARSARGRWDARGAGVPGDARGARDPRGGLGARGGGANGTRRQWYSNDQHTGGRGGGRAIP